MKMFLMCLCYTLFGVLTVYPPIVRSYPHQTMMVSGYYGRSRYLPQGAMTAFATRDAAASNSWPGDDAEEEEGADGNVVKRPETKPDIAETTQDEAAVQEQEITTKRVPINKKPSRPQLEDTDGDEESVWPMRHRGVPSFNTFFPIIFGGRGANQSGGTYPGSATAIANSFSTGKGGIASSHAVAYGDPCRGNNGERKGLLPKNEA